MHELLGYHRFQKITVNSRTIGIRDISLQKLFMIQLWNRVFHTNCYAMIAILQGIPSSININSLRSCTLCVFASIDIKWQVLNIKILHDFLSIRDQCRQESSIFNWPDRKPLRRVDRKLSRLEANGNAHSPDIGLQPKGFSIRVSIGSGRRDLRNDQGKAPFSSACGRMRKKI